MKMSVDIRQFSYVEKLATLTQLYLELRLPLAAALRAANADLQMPIYKPPSYQSTEVIFSTSMLATPNNAAQYYFPS
jgi:hypothetical protein